MSIQEIQLLKPNYRPDIDGLRAVAVIAVVAFHGFPNWLSGGFIGVDIFFVISGFLICTIIFENLDAGTFTFAEFYSRRIKRIFPALLIVLFTCLVIGWFALLADEYKQLSKHITASAGFISNFILWSESGYFDNSSESKPLLHLWSLSIEEQFYIVWPLIIWMARKQKINLLTIQLFFIIISFVLNVKGVQKDVVASFYSPLSRIWEVLCGCLLAYLMLYKRGTFSDIEFKLDYYLKKFIYSDNRIADGKTLKNTFSFFGFFLLLYGVFRINKQLAYPGAWALVPVMGTLMIIMAGSKAWLNKKIFSNYIVVWFGLISYPLYLWHYPLLSFARIIEGGTPSESIRILALVLSVALSWITYKLIEIPIRMGGRVKIQVAVLIVLMGITGLIGYNIYKSDGLKFRSNIKMLEGQNEDLVFREYRMNGWLCDKLKTVKCYYTGENPSVVIMGDSHAARIYSGLSKLYSSQFNKNVGVFGGGDGCPPLINVVSKINGGEDTFDCISNTTVPLQIIIENSSIYEVVLTSRGPLYTTSDGFGIEKYGQWVLHRENEKQGLRTNSDIFFEALGYTIDAITSSGKQVTYLHDVPELGFDIRACLKKRPLTITSNIKEPCAVLRSEFEERNRDFRAQVTKILKDRPSVRVIDLSEALCDDKYCYGSRDGVLFYEDDDHLSHRGSEFVFLHLLDKFK